MPACKFYIPAGKELPTQTLRFGRLFTFINEGKEDEKQGFRPRLVDWEQGCCSDRTRCGQSAGV